MDTRYLSIAKLMNAHGRRIMTGLVTLLVVAAAASPGFAQGWAEKMFDHTTHDFGVVATGAKVEHRFEFTNLYEEDVHVVSTKSSCGCSSVESTKKTIAKFETAEIVVKLDTRNFSHRKDATITVEFSFDKPTEEGIRKSPTVEVRLNTYAYIRQDVVLTPGSVQFGSVRVGTAASKEIDLAYAGDYDWQITEIECANPHILVQATETGRGRGTVKYRIQFDLDDKAPVAHIRDHVILVTNDDNQNAKRVLVTVEGIVDAPVRVTPSPLSLGIVSPDTPVTKNLVVTSDDSFKLVDVTSEDDRFKFGIRQAAATTLIRVVFTPDERRGPIASKITVQTDIQDHEMLVVPVTGRVGSPEEDAGTSEPTG